MRNISFICLVLSITACTNSTDNKEKELQSLLDNKEYFKLRDRLSVESDQISDAKKIFFRAYVRNAFNDNGKSNEDIEALLTKYTSAISDSSKANLLEKQADNYFKTFQYAAAASVDSELVKNYSTKLDSERLSDIKNDLLARKGLRNISPQELYINGNDTVYWKKDKVGLIEIPVRQKDSVYSCIFDTRANISTISKTYAAKLHLKILDDSFDVGSGLTGITFKSRMGIADSIFIGHILVRNVVFQVLPDEVLYFEPIQFRINVIIGYPVIQQLKEVQVYQDGKMIIPKKATSTDLHNLAMDGLSPIIAVKTGNDTLGFHFDSGATSSDFYSTYFDKYKKEITSRGKLQKVQTGGAGGTITTEVYALDSVVLNIANKPITLKNVGVHIKAIDKHWKEKFYGNLGQDLISPFKVMIINFDDMYIDFR